MSKPVFKDKGTLAETYALEEYKRERAAARWSAIASFCRFVAVAGLIVGFIVVLVHFIAKYW